jgi:hypothetical protein
MGQINMATRNELVVALAERYAASNRKECGRILDEFTALNGLHRKHAMRLLRAGQSHADTMPLHRHQFHVPAVLLDRRTHRGDGSGDDVEPFRFCHTRSPRLAPADM